MITGGQEANVSRIVDQKVIITKDFDNMFIHKIIFSSVIIVKSDYSTITVSSQSIAERLWKVTCLISIKPDVETCAIEIITQMICFSVKKANFVVQMEPTKKAAQRNADPMIQKVIY